MTARPIDAVALLSEPTRRALYECVVRSHAPVTRDEAAEATGTARSLAAFHLDKLVEAGLLEADFRRVSGKSGPGAGRPAKLYRRAGAEVAVSLPARQYDLAGALLADAVQANPAAKAALRKTARQRGRDMGSALRAARHGKGRRGETAVAALERQGFEPVREAGGTIRLHNCPFHALVADHKELVCGMNLALLTGLLEGLEEEGYEAVLAPEPGFCCVAFKPEAR